MTVTSRLTAIVVQLGTNKVQQLVIITVILSSVIISRLGPLTVRQLAMTMKTLSRITAILFQLGTINVKQLAITTVVLSRGILFIRPGSLTVTHHTKNAAILSSQGCPTGMIQLGTFTVTQLTHKHRLRHRPRLRRVSQSQPLTGVHER